MKFIINKFHLFCSLKIVLIFAFLFKIKNVPQLKRSYSFEELKSEYLKAIKRIDELYQQNRLLRNELTEKKSSDIVPKQKY